LKQASIAILTDFDGTLTKADIGNELCLEAAPELYRNLEKKLKSEEISLLEYQEKMWSHFPMSESHFRNRARHHAELRDGVNEFLEHCLNIKIPVYVASCGLRPYIEEVLNFKLSPNASKAILETRCNEAHFGPTSITSFIAPKNVNHSPWPLDKGAWAQELKQTKSYDFVIGIGNGTSDRSFCGAVDALFATDGLARYCDKTSYNYSRFDNFFEIKELLKHTQEHAQNKCLNTPSKEKL